MFVFTNNLHWQQPPASNMTVCSQVGSVNTHCHQILSVPTRYCITHTGHTFLPLPLPPSRGRSSGADVSQLPSSASHMLPLLKLYFPLSLECKKLLTSNCYHCLAVPNSGKKRSKKPSIFCPTIYDAITTVEFSCIMANLYLPIQLRSEIALDPNFNPNMQFKLFLVSRGVFSGPLDADIP